MTITDIDKPVELQQRGVVRKGLSGLRQSGMIPAVVHDHGKPSVHVMGPALELQKVYRAAGKHHPLQLKIEDKDYLALIKDVHINPVRRNIQHIVFQAIKKDEKVEAEVPIRIEGEVPAEKAGLMLLHQLDHVEVEALPQNLPDELVIDGSRLEELHDKVMVADLAVAEGVTILTEAEHPIVTVVETRAQISEETEAAEDEEGTEDETEGTEGGEKPENDNPAEGSGQKAEEPGKKD